MPGFNVNTGSPGNQNLFGLDTFNHHPGRAFVGGTGGGSGVDLGRVYRWLVRIRNVGSNTEIEFALAAKKISRPEFTFEKITIHQGQNEMYLPGKYKWSPIEIEFYEKLELKDVNPTGRNGAFRVDYAPTESKSTAMLRRWWSQTVSDYKLHSINPSFKKIIDIYMTDGNGRPAHVWKLFGAWPMSVSGSSFDNTSTELSTSTVKISYDTAEEHGANGFINDEGL